MRRFALAILVLGLMAAPLAKAQTESNDRNRQQTASDQSINLAGKVSNGGKTLIAKDDSVWSVSNPGKLQGYEGLNVTVRCRTTSDTRSIDVLSVVDPYWINNMKDKAFRK
jgi:hypothetical protein